MKTYVLLAALWFLFTMPSPAKIRNGYAMGIESARMSLRNLRILIGNDHKLSVFQRLTIHDKIDRLTRFVTYHELTEDLLDQFRTISPDLYYRIDAIGDRLGRPVVVYVKCVPEREMPGGVAGITSMEGDKNDRDGCVSEYGGNTVSVKISAVRKVLFLLAHELGHVAYQVPNLQDYQQFYLAFYLAGTYSSESMGHNDKDPSGRLAHEFTKRFRAQYMDFLKRDGNRVASHLALMQQIKRRI